MRRVLPTLLACPLVALAGCGNSRTPVPSSQSAASPPAGATSASGFQTLRYTTAGIALRVPRSWSVRPGPGPLIATVTSGSSVVAVWRFPRNVGPPASPAALTRARTILIHRAKLKDPRLVLIRSSITRVDGSPTIEIDAFEQIAGQARRVRSTHVFEHRAEVVLDEYAPPAQFHAVDHVVFSPVKRSLQLSGASA